jgi:hypothetical protein
VADIKNYLTMYEQLDELELLALQSVKKYRIPAYFAAARHTPAV